MSKFNDKLKFLNNAQFLPNAITKVTIPKNTICSSLSDINIATLTQNSSLTWDQIGCIVLPSKEKLSGNYLTFDDTCGTAISKCTYTGPTLETLNIPPGVEYVLSGAFSGTGLLNVDFSSSTGLKKIYDGAFSNSRIQSITLPNAFTDFGVGLFSGLNSLINVNITSNLIELHRNLFYGCLNLSRILINTGEFLKDDVLNFSKVPNLDYIGENCLSGVPFKKIVFSNKINFQEIALIGIRGNANLEEVVIPYYIYDFENNLFAGCSNLKTITIEKINILENKVLYLQYINRAIIEHSAFSGVSISDIRISETANFSEYSFLNVKGLTRVTIVDYTWKDEFYLPPSARNIPNSGSLNFYLGDKLIGAGVCDYTSYTKLTVGAFQHSNFNMVYVSPSINSPPCTLR